MGRLALRPAIRAYAHAPAGVAGPAAAWTPEELTTELWLDASDASTITESGGAVSQWDDKSGNSANAVQATGADQPTTGVATINSLNVLSFDVDNMAATIAAGTFSSSIMIHAVLKKTGAAISFEAFTTRTAAGKPSPVDSWNNRLYIGNGTANSYLTCHDIKRLTSASIMSIAADATYAYQYVNGTETLNSAHSTTYGDTGAYVNIGTRADGVTTFRGDYGEIVVTALLSTADRQKTEGYLAWKWGLQGFLPGPPGGYTTKFCSFDGVDDKGVAAANWATPADEYSVSCWAKIPSDPSGLAVGDRLLEMHGDTGDADSFRFSIQISGGSYDYIYYYEGDADASSPSTALAYIRLSDFRDDTWHHYAVTSEGTGGGTRKIYLDGALVQTVTNGLALSGSPHALNMYVANDAGSRYTPCSVAEIAIYDTALPATGTTSIAALYNSGSPAAPPATGLINHLRMGDGTGDDSTTIADQVGNQDLTLTNGPTVDDVHPYKDEAPTA